MYHSCPTGLCPGTNSFHSPHISYCRHCLPLWNQSTAVRRWHSAVLFRISIPTICLMSTCSLVALMSCISGSGLSMNAMAQYKSSQIQSHLIWHPSTSPYYFISSVSVAGCQIPVADHIRIIGVALDRNHSMDNHVNALSKSIHYYIHALRPIPSYISEDKAKMVAL